MSEPVNIERAAALLRGMQDVLILTHKNPDGDTLGSAFALWDALRRLKIRARVHNEGPIPDKYGYMTAPYAKFAEDFEPKQVVSVDIAAVKLMGEKTAAQYADRVALAIDHHGSNEGYAKQLTVCDPGSASCCELIARLTDALGVRMDTYMASCIYTGLATDTGCFKYANTTADSHLLAARLIGLGVDYAALNRLLFETKSRGRIRLEQMALAGIEFAADGKIALITITQEMLRYAGCDYSDIEGVTPIPRTIEGVELGVTLRELENGNYKVSLRSVELDSAKICALFGGGGHKRAAGFECSGTPHDIKAAVVAAAEAEMNR